MRAAQLRLRLFNVSVAKGAPQCANPYRAIDDAQPTKVWYLSFRLAEFDPETYWSYIYSTRRRGIDEFDT